MCLVCNRAPSECNGPTIFEAVLAVCAGGRAVCPLNGPDCFWCANEMDMATALRMQDNLASIVERAIIAELVGTETPLSDWEIEFLGMELGVTFVG